MSPDYGVLLSLLYPVSASGEVKLTMPSSLPALLQDHRHRLPSHLRVAARPILGGLYHEYRLEEKVA